MFYIRIKILIVVFALYLISFSSISWAVCGGSSPNWTAASANQTDFEDCMTAATSGDTVNIPSGPGSGSGRTSLTKTLNIIGAGYGLTTLSYGFTIGTAASNTAIKEIYFNGGTIKITSGTDYGGTPVTGWVISGCRFAVGSSGVITVNNGSTGLIADNLFDVSNAETVIYVYGRDGTDWAGSTFFGEAGKYVFIEDNKFNETGYLNHTVLASWGASYVARCNRSDGGNDTDDTHGYGHGTSRHSARLVEIYGNQFDNNDQARAIQLRGGSALVFANRADTAQASYNVHLADYRMSFYSGMPSGMAYPSDNADCTSSSGSLCTIADQATCCSDHEGYPCCGQFGWGGYGGTAENNNQVLAPAYFWDNQRSGGSAWTVTVQSGTPTSYIQENREFYVNSDYAGSLADGLSSGYAPYTYPHPDRGLGATYTCLSGANSEADTGITFWTSTPASGAGSATAGGNGSMVAGPSAAGSVTVK